MAAVASRWRHCVRFDRPGVSVVKHIAICAAGHGFKSRVGRIGHNSIYLFHQVATYKQIIVAVGIQPEPLGEETAKRPYGHLICCLEVENTTQRRQQLASRHRCDVSSEVGPVTRRNAASTMKKKFFMVAHIFVFEYYSKIP